MEKSKKKKSKKGLRQMIDISELEFLRENQIKNVSLDVLFKKLKEKFTEPFQVIIDELESKKDDIEELTDQIDDLTNR